ncbi:MAG: hypothetical protein HY741_08535 [Chloroflexi bacterium]|nr:hypothetical protein [Chloroflexota bacterium]
MPQTFTCPKCGAPQDYTGGAAATIQCPYCETTLIVPPELRTTSSNAAMSDAAWTRESAALVEIKRLLESGQKIQAIKVYREHFGGGLKDAKDAVEAIARGQNVQVAQISFSGGANTPTIGIHATPYVTAPRAQGGTGCATAIIVIVVLVIIGSIVVPLVVAGMDIFNALAPVVTTPPPVIASATEAPLRTAAAIPTPTPPPTPGFADVVKSFSEKGTAPGQLNDARSLAVDNKGNVYVGEYTGARIQRFDAQGEFQDQWGGNSKQILFGLAADFRGNVYAVLNGVITKFDGATGKQLSQFKYAVPGEGFDAIATTPDGGLVGMWYEQRTGFITSLEGHREDLVRFDREGQVTNVIQGVISSQTDNFEVDNPLAVDSSGNVYILSRERDGAIFKFSAQGKLLSRFGSRGSETGQLNSGDAIAVDSKGRVYVGATDGVMVFTSDGRYLDTFSNNHAAALSMAFDAQNRLWVLSNDKIMLFRLNQ